MPEIPLGLNAQKRRTAWMPSILAVNMLLEQTQTNRFNGLDHIQRPGLTLFATIGLEPIRGVYRQAGTFNGDFWVASGDKLYRVTEAGIVTLITGTMLGTGRTVTAATATFIVTVSGTTAYRGAGAAIATLLMPDSRPVSSVAQLNGYFILTEADSARFYWMEPGQLTPDALSFATTESTPGDNLKVERVGDELWFFKEEGIEVWAPTGDADLPFQRIPGRNYDKGCRARDTIVRFDNSVAWVGNDGIVYRGDNTPVRFSDHSLEEQIRKSSADGLRAWTFDFDGHTLYCLTLDQGTYAYDASSQKWCEFQSYGRAAWRAHVGDRGETFVVAGDDETGILYRLDPEASNDNGEPLVRQVSGGVPVVGAPVRCDNLQLYVTTGTATDPNLYPKVRIRWSDDLETWEDWEDVSIGRQGQYGEPVRLDRLGMMRYPGRLFEFQVTDDVVSTISSASYNEPSR